MTFLYKSDPVRGAVWARLFAEKAPMLPFRMWPDVGDLNAVRYLAAWTLPEKLDQDFPNLEVLFSVAAGVDQLDFSGVPAHIPVVRMVEPAIINGMVEYVTEAVISIQRDMMDYAHQQRDQEWRPLPVRSASQTRVGVMGLGVLGTAVLTRLRLFGYLCRGWNRSIKSLDGVECFAGADKLQLFLGQIDILICLVPLTDETRGILSRTVLEMLPKGASLIQTGRGPHLDHDALLDLLNTGHIRCAYLDVTDPEPLPIDHPFWTHDRVRITPHIASATRPESAVEVVLDNIRRYECGAPMLGLVDRKRGY